MLPFAALALWAWLPAVPQQTIDRLFLVYALAISAFLSGTLWGRASEAAGGDKILRLCISNAFVLAGAFSVAFTDAVAAAWLFLLMFWAILAFEWKVTGQRGWYLRYRLQLTVVVSLCHGTFIAAHP